jgi:bacteriorhodopsin
VQLVFLAISMIAFFFVMAAIIAMFRGALAETQQDQPVHSLMERFLWLTLLVWSLFPLVWTLAWLGYVSLSTEQVSTAAVMVVVGGGVRG